MRECANCCGVVCPRKLFERESPFDQGATTTRSLSVPLFSALSCIERYISSALYSLFLYLSQSAADLLEVREPKEMSKEEDSVKEAERESFHLFGTKGKVKWVDFEKSIARHFRMKFGSIGDKRATEYRWR